MLITRDLGGSEVEVEVEVEVNASGIGGVGFFVVLGFFSSKYLLGNNAFHC